MPAENQSQNLDASLAGAVPPEWDEAVERLAEDPGTVLVLGASDTGKSTFVRLLLQRLGARTGVGLVDTDVGQSTLGPPGCVALARLSPRRKTVELSRVQPEAMAFARTLSPGSDPLGFFLAVQRIARRAAGFRLRHLVVDTTGFIQGDLAVELKLAKVEWFRPRWIVALQRGGELEPVLSRLPEGEARTVRLPVPRQVKRRSRELRRAYREERWSAYFAGSRELEIGVSRLPFRNFWFGGGIPLEEPERLRLERELDCPVLYGERQREGVFLVTDGFCRQDVAFWRGFSGEALRLFPARRLLESILAFVRKDGLTEALGIFLDFNPQRRTFRVQTPLKSLESVAWIEMGNFAFRPFP